MQGGCLSAVLFIFYLAQALSHGHPMQAELCTYVSWFMSSTRSIIMLKHFTLLPSVIRMHTNMNLQLSPNMQTTSPMSLPPSPPSIAPNPTTTWISVIQQDLENHATDIDLRKPDVTDELQTLYENRDQWKARCGTRGNLWNETVLDNDDVLGSGLSWNSFHTFSPFYQKETGVVVMMTI